ncbi:MAG: squalene/phytoene synthase family protein [Pseudomonadota bacterium]
MTGLEALAPSPAPPGADPDAIAAAITAKSQTSFSTGMRILPAERRRGMWALYAFSRVIDDIADGPDDGEDWPLADKHRLLDAWRDEIGALYAGRPVSAIGLALAGPVARYELPQEEFLALIDGMQMDADGPIIAPPRAELARYSRRVAGTVGLLSMRIFGAWRGAVSERFALALADAFQLTNILRDIETDAEMGRLYLPLEPLRVHGLPLEPLAAARHPALPSVAATLGREARAHFAEARGLIRAHARHRIAPALLMMGVYAAYLARMEAVGFSRDARVRLSSAEKLWSGLACLIAPGRAAAPAGEAHG